MRTTAQFDVLIVGGGVVGLSFALALADATSLSIAIIDSHDTPLDWQETEYQPRVSAITLASKRIFQKLAAWPLMVAKRVSAFGRIEVWNSGKKQYALPFNSQDIHANQLGYIIENQVLQVSLREVLAQQTQVKFITTTLTKFVSDETASFLTAENGDCYEAALVVGADGANSWLREKAHMAVDVVDYHESAIVATITTALAHESTARQCFLQGGPLGILPLNSPHLSSIVWSQSDARANYLMNLEIGAFKHELQMAMDDCLGEVTDVMSRHLFPLKRQQAATYIGTRLALIGDAAHVVHPLAGQGVNMGLLDAASLAEVMSDAILAKQDFASQKVLRRYERWRRADNSIMQQGIDVIKTLFANNHLYFTEGANLGLQVLRRLPVLKNMFMRHAVGDRGNLPRLAG